MPWPSYGNAYSGQPGPAVSTAVTVHAHRGGAWTPITTFAHRSGQWRPSRFYRLPITRVDNIGTMQANFGFTATMNGSTDNVGTMQANFGFTATMAGTNVATSATTVVNITDLLAAGETLSSTVNCTTAMQNCINRAIRRSGHPVITAVTTDHLTIDFENTYWRVENSMAFPSDTEIANRGIYYVCQNWPKGMTWQNGGIQAVSKDGHTSGTGGTPVATINKNRYHIRLQQATKRKASSNANQMLEWDNFWIKGPLTYATNDAYQTQVLPREGQEAIYFSGMQWFRMVDCIIEQQYADTMFFQERDDLLDLNNQGGVVRDRRVFPGMIEVLGGTFRRPGIMNATLNTCRPPDAVYTDGWWRNNVATKFQNGVGYTDHPSASGQQYGLWWHGNAAHPFQSIDHMRSWIDMEQQVSYGMAGDIRIGADTDKAHFRIMWDQKPEARDANTIQHFDFTQIRRFRMQHIFIDGAMNIGFLGSPSAVLDENNQATRTLAASSIGDVLTGNDDVINVTVDPANSPTFPPSGRILVPTTVGHTHVRYTGRTSNGFTGCDGGFGTMAAGTVRNASIKRDGCNIAAGSNNVTLGAVGSRVGGTGFLNVDDHSAGQGMNPSPSYVRIWTTGGPAVIKTGAKVGITQWKDCTVESGTGLVLRTGQAVTYAFDSPERIPYCTGGIELDDIEATLPSQSKTLGVDNCDGFKVVNCKSPYRATNVPFSTNSNVRNFDKGGPGQFGSNNFFPV